MKFEIRYIEHVIKNVKENRRGSKVCKNNFAKHKDFEYVDSFNKPYIELLY